MSSFINASEVSTMLPHKRQQRFNPEETKERRRKRTQRRKRKIGAIKKAHGLKKYCEYEVALFILNPETGQIYTYRSTDDAVWASLFKEIVSLFQQLSSIC
jgi:hypothetical protein